ncbi:G-alpha-domain-containing protein [Stereum hirsutum FP-91666 SS1]|uniref:G-alpha-domain-containing protein n=1 Tax=Stereum hirsutum (strain FP-91666) TaxID=721885 RepID=UPI000444A28A|nr:G-alpha-domain-containing protein [Stereum hirsutum FP-91666 SS1]EIM83217.1 G-alpha-domain-containing protein [Stereum hirsutum FP-91666 SS1]
MPSAPNKPRRSLSDPLAAALRPPPNETSAAREARLQMEAEAQKVSDAIDEQLRQEKALLKKQKPDVKVLLLGQSESGKSTTLKQFQLLHTPAAFHAERIAWRSVIYLNLVRSIRRILDAISPDSDSFSLSDSNSTTNIAHDLLDDSSSVHTTVPDPDPDPLAPEKHAYYAQRLGLLVELEERLMRMLSEEEGEEEATRLDDGSTPGWSTPHDGYNGKINGNGTLSPTRKSQLLSSSPPPSSHNHRPYIAIDTTTSSSAVASSAPSSSRSSNSTTATMTTPSSNKELSVRTTSNWKKALSLSRTKLKATSPGTNEILGWWEDPSDPVHVLSSLRPSMLEIWSDPWVRTRLRSKRIRLEESSGFYLDEIDRITAKKYIPTDEDVLKARLKTMGVVEHSFTLSSGASKGMNWKIYDVGGARNQRQAWAPYFQDVNAIIFLAPISAFDQVLAEDTRINRLEDSLLLWRSVISNKLLSHVNIILFLNKCDLLQKKLDAGVLLAQHLLSYGDRPNDYDSVSKYLRNKFGVLHQQSSPNKDRELYIHFTAVTDTRRTVTIIQSVRDFILRANLKHSELIA